MPVDEVEEGGWPSGNQNTVKGQMWRDLGLGHDFFEVQAATGAALWQRLACIHADYPAAQARVATLCARVSGLQREMALAVRRAVGLGMR